MFLTSLESRPVACATRCRWRMVRCVRLVIDGPSGQPPDGRGPGI